MKKASFICIIKKNSYLCGKITKITKTMTPHINAKDGAFAKTVLMPGDPLRAKFIAENFLQDAELVTNVRNVLGYTGTYNGKPVSVMASGMGMPSIGIYSMELFTQYGVENIIRIGSAGSYTEKLNVMDVVLASEVYSDSTYAQLQNGYDKKTIKPSTLINDTVISVAGQLNIDCKMGVIHSADVFYSNEAWQSIAERTGTDCVEMEAFALFHNANVTGKRAACLLTISDSFCTKKELSAEERQNSFTTMMRLALETAAKLDEAK